MSNRSNLKPRGHVPLRTPLLVHVTQRSFLRTAFEGAPPPPHRSQPCPNEPSRHRLFAEHQISELVTSKSSRVRADDSAPVSAKCRPENRPETALKNVLFAA